MTKTPTTWERTRKFFNDVHLWLGLASGIIVFLVCLSGTIYTFNTEIREAATPALFKVQAAAGQRVLPAETMIANLEATTGGKVVNVKVPAEATRSWQFGVKKESKEGKGEGKAKVEGRSERAGKPADAKAAEAKGGAAKGGPKGGGRPTTYYVNPYTGEILGNTGEIKNGTVTFMTYMFSLHRWLLLDKVEEPIFEGLENRELGSYISGTATILFTLGVITGMVIWFPRKMRAWKQGLKIKTNGSWKRTNHDLHNTLGFYSCIFLFLMGVTGPFFSFDWYRNGLRKSLGTYEAPAMTGESKGAGDGKGKGEGRGERGERGERGTRGMADAAAEAPKTVSFAALQATTNQVFNFKGDYMIALGGGEGPIAVSKFKTGFFAPAAADKVIIDPVTAQPVEVVYFAKLPFNERVSASIKSLHLGDVYGMFTKIIYFFACLIATSLPVTGTMIWLNKMKKKPARRNQPKEQDAMPVTTSL